MRILIALLCLFYAGVANAAFGPAWLAATKPAAAGGEPTTNLWLSIGSNADYYQRSAPGDFDQSIESATKVINRIRINCALLGDGVSGTITVQLRDAPNGGGNAVGSSGSWNGAYSNDSFAWFQIDMPNVSISSGVYINITYSGCDSMKMSASATSVYSGGTLYRAGVDLGVDGYVEVYTQ